MSIFATELGRKVLTAPNPKQNTEICLLEMNVGYSIQNVADWFKLSSKDIQSYLDTDGVNVYCCYTGAISVYMKHSTVHKIMQKFEPDLLAQVNQKYLTTSPKE